MTSRASDLHRLQRLHRWLTLEGWAGVGALAGFWLPATLLGGALGLAAVAFLPVLVVSLWRLGRRGWLAALAVVVGGAALAVLGAGGASVALGGAAVLFAFYAFVWALKLTVAEWVREAEEAARWQTERAYANASATSVSAWS